MSTLRIRLTSWQDLGQATGAPTSSPGTDLTGRVQCIPSLSGGGVLSDGLHTVASEDITSIECPWSYDLLDPTDAQPSGWGWTIRLSPGPYAGSVIVPLTAELIAATPQVDGVRLIDLSQHVGQSSITAQGGLLSPARGITTMAVDSTSGELSADMTDGTTQAVPGLPSAIEQLVSTPVQQAATQAYTDAQTATDQAGIASAAASSATEQAGIASAAAATVAQQVSTVTNAANSADQDASSAHIDRLAAETSAQTASDRASAAGDSAQMATQQASAASGSAATAQTAATNASTSASQASSSAVDAGASRDTAQTQADRAQAQADRAQAITAAAVWFSPDPDDPAALRIIIPG